MGEREEEELEEQLRDKWRLYAYDSVVPDGMLFYFVLTSSFNDQVVLPAWGEDKDDARRRLEAGLRILGVQRLCEFDSGPIYGRLALPVCPSCRAIMIPEDRWSFWRLRAWRCGVKSCWRIYWTWAAGAAQADLPSVLGSRSPYDIDM